MAHLALAGYVATRPDEVIAPRVVEAEMIFTELPPPKVEEPPPEEVKEPEPVAPPPPPPVKVAVVRPPPPPRDVKITPPPPQDVPTDVPRDLPTADVPRELPKLTLGLVPNSTLVLKLDAGVPREVEVINGTGLHGLEAPKDVVGILAKETIGRGRVDRGLVHPYYSQLGKALIKNWDADRVAANGLKGLVEQTSQNLKLYNEIWADRAQQYGSSGNPLGDTGPSNNRRAVANDRVTALNGTDLEQRKELQKSLKESFRAVRRAVIRVVQDKDGKLLKVELVQPSQDSNVDREALVDVKNAAEKLPPPPAEALEGKTQLSSLWTFELIVSISPPVPTISFEFDEALGFIDARLPLDRRIYKKVKLYAVE
ncbi:MAG: energy transducer TonB [Archangium sp.]|nr:energy transducer TonB [Archangium sp.]